MIFLVDAQLSPAVAAWITRHFAEHEANSARALGLQRATDLEIFHAARERGATVITKDADFLSLVETHGTPPSVIWITCGNTSNARMRAVLSRSLETAIDLIQAGEAVVEITDE